MPKLLILFFSSVLLPAIACAQPYPNRAIRFVVPSPPGGITDILARAISKTLTDVWAQPVIVDNRPGAGQNYGSEIVAKSQPDGYTILFGGIANTIAPALYPKLAYDPIKDLAWVTNMARVPVLLVVYPNLPVNNVKELIALAKAQPGKLTYGSSGIATSGHLAGELLRYMAQIDITHVPYKGSALALPDTISGRVSVYLGAMSSPMPYVRSGRLRAIGICSIQRSPAEPDTPTLHEQGLTGFDTSTFYAVATRAGTPTAIINKLNEEIVRAIKRPEVSKSLAAAGADFVGDSPAAITAFVKSETEKWGKIIKLSGTRVE